jgi:hypothetical protein
VWFYVMTMCVLGDPGTKHTRTGRLYMVADRSSRNRQLESVLIPFRGVCYLACRASRTLMICGRVHATHPQTYVRISCSDVDLIPFRRRMIFCLHVLMIFYAFCFATAICLLTFLSSILPQVSVSLRQPGPFLSADGA